MDLHQFSVLSEDERIELTLFNGIYLSSYSNRVFKKDLFRLEGFYVEVVYLLGTHDICKINAFDREALLGPYLEQIDLSSLFN